MTDGWAVVDLGLARWSWGPVVKTALGPALMGSQLGEAQGLWEPRGDTLPILRGQGGLSVGGDGVR